MSDDTAGVDPRTSCHLLSLIFTERTRQSFVAAVAPGAANSLRLPDAVEVKSADAFAQPTPSHEQPRIASAQQVVSALAMVACLVAAIISSSRCMSPNGVCADSNQNCLITQSAS